MTRTGTRDASPQPDRPFPRLGTDLTGPQGTVQGLTDAAGLPRVMHRSQPWGCWAPQLKRNCFSPLDTGPFGHCVGGSRGPDFRHQHGAWPSRVPGQQLEVSGGQGPSQALRLAPTAQSQGNAGLRLPLYCKGLQLRNSQREGMLGARGTPPSQHLPLSALLGGSSATPVPERRSQRLHHWVGEHAFLGGGDGGGDCWGAAHTQFI